MRVDDALELLGGYGRFQLVVFFVIGLNFMYTPMHIFSDVFTANEPEHRCKLMENETEELRIPQVDQIGDVVKVYDSCSVYTDEFRNQTEPCPHGFHYRLEETGHSIVTEWQLSCNKSQWVLIITAHGAAAVLGAVVFSPFADAYGRKALFLMCWWQTALLSLGMVFVNDISSFLVLRFLSRLNTEGAELAMFILACEYFPVDQRPFAAFTLYLFYATGQMLLALQGYLTKSWRMLQLSISVGVLILLPFNMFLPESPHWLISWGRTRSAERIIRRAAKFNKVCLPPGFHLDPAMEDNGEEPPSPDPFSSGVGKSNGETRLHLLHPHLSHFKKLLAYMNNATLRRDFLIGSFLWAVSAYNYYGLTTIPIKLKVLDGLYLNYFLGGLVMVPAFCSIFILKRFGRKRPLLVFFAVTGVFVIIYSVFPVRTASGYHLGIAHLVVKLIAKCATTAALVSTRLLVAELFPTSVRSTFTGLAAFLGFLGGSAGLYFPLVKTLTKWSGVVVGLLTLLAAVLCLLLPETSNRPLPETIKDLMLQYRTVLQNMLLSQLNAVKLEEKRRKSSCPSRRPSKINTHFFHTDVDFAMPTNSKERLHSLAEAASVTNVVGIAARTMSHSSHESIILHVNNYDNFGYSSDEDKVTKL